MTKLKTLIFFVSLTWGAASSSVAEAALPPFGWSNTWLNVYIGQLSGRSGTYVCYQKNDGSNEFSIVKIGDANGIWDATVKAGNMKDFIVVHYGGPNYNCGSFGTINGPPINFDPVLEIYGFGGDDYIYGGNKTWIIWGGDGNDDLRSSSPGVTMYGGFGNDRIYWNGTGNAYLYGQEADDCLQADGPSSYVDGGSGTDGCSRVSGTMVNCERAASCGD